jgi:DNA invertase Pin-like site-specific DNA recombinase
MTGKRIGYVRVSSSSQNPDRQLIDLKLDKTFTDFASASSTTNRPQLRMLMDYVREEDTVYVHSMDRLARNVKDLKEIVDYLTSKKVRVHFLKENLHFGGEQSSIQDLIFHILGAFAQFEHSFIRERQQEGIEIAKKKGRYRGREKKLTTEKAEAIKQALQTRKPKTTIAEDLGISRMSLYKYMKQLKLA